MNKTESNLSTSLCDEDELVGVLEGYLADIEGGHGPDREAIVAAHPQIADRLLDCLASLQFVRSSAQEVTASSADPTQTPLQSLGQLGDYRIVREIARGGMGVVYEAEQVSLPRRVALKVLPFAAVLDNRQLQRFKNEARAAATLDHPGIVSIYSVGNERGVHYYAMQLVEGQTLEQLIRELRQLAGGDTEVVASQVSQLTSDVASGWLGPSRKRAGGDDPTTSFGNKDTQQELREAETARQPHVPVSTDDSTRSPAYFRTIANLGIQAAKALDHAHVHGVLHRDIKPSNLLLDVEGTLRITDFGLARIEADVGMTRTGDLLGTLRYMSPEQALAKRAVVDHRADIYSLGATLYELLTLRAVYDGNDREELLKQIAFDDPRLPRRINKAIPRDLETIVLKAMRKNPEERYATAQELADDLEHYLNDEPIKAKRPTLAQRTAKWSRRHSGLVTGLLTMLVVVLLCLLVSTVLISGALNRSERAQREAIHERNDAQSNLYVAHVRLAHQEWQNGHLASVVSALDTHIPTNGHADRRDWEWYYLKSLCHKDLVTFQGHTATVKEVAWSPEGQRLASASDDWTVKVWDTVTEREFTTLRGHEGSVTSLAWSPDGTRVASGSADKTVRVWDWKTGDTTLKIAVDVTNVQSGDTPSVRSLSWSPDGKRLAGSVGSALSVWDASSGQQVWRSLADSLVWSVAWSPDGTKLATGENHQLAAIRIWDATSGKQIREVLRAHTHALLTIAWSRDGSHLASGSMDQHVKIWDTTSWQEIGSLRQHNGTVRSVAWNDTGELVASGGDDGKVVVWDIGGDREVRTLRGHRAAVTSVCWRPDGKRLASSSTDGSVKIWDPHREQAYTRLNGTKKVISWSPNGKHFATRHSESVIIFDAMTQAKVLEWSILKESSRGVIDSLAWSPDGKRLAAGCYDWEMNSLGLLKVWEIATQKEVLSVHAHLEGAIKSVAWSPDGSVLATAGTDKLVKIWNAATGTQVVTLAAHRDCVASVAWSPNGSRLATASWDQIVKVWDTSTWREILHLNCHPGESAWGGGDRGYSVAWDPDGNRLAAGSAKGWIIVWDAVTGRELLSFSPHTANIRCIAWSPNGRRLASGSEDRTIKISDADTGDQLMSLRGHESVVLSLAWSPSGKQLLSTSKVAILWDASIGYDAVPVAHSASSGLGNKDRLHRSYGMKPDE